MEEQTNGKQAYEEKKIEKIREQEARQKRVHTTGRTRSVVRWIIVLAIVGGLGFLFVRSVQKELPQGEAYGQSFPIQGEEHVAVGAAHEPYNTNPPTSGPHYASPAPVGFYASPLPDERVVHNLEHGDVWLAYHPRVTDNDAVISALRAFEHDGKVIITPREANEFDISLAAWGWLDSFDLEDGVVDAARVGDFIKRHRNRGPERVNQPHVDNVE